MNMKSDMATYVSYPILGSVIGLIIFQIPLLGALLFIPLLPLSGLYDAIIPGEFSSTGQHVEIGFAWITFKTWQAWLFYGSFFFLVGLLLVFLRTIDKSRNRPKL